MHVVTNTIRRGEREYHSHLLRRSWREDGKVRNETVANLSHLPAETIELVRRSLAGQRFVPAESAARVVRSRPHGDVAAVWAQAKALGLPGLLGPAGRHRDLALALIVSRVVRPASKLSTLGWWSDVTLGEDLGVAGASTDEVYAAMDWLTGRQDRIETALARRHLTSRDGPPMALFDLSSSWVEGRCCPLAARGYSRDRRKGALQIEYGLLTDGEGRPVAVRVFPGNTADPAAFVAAVDTVRSTFALDRVTMVGDRGMITNARITALRDLGGIGWVTALRAPQIATLAAGDGPLQLTLFDTQDLAEITHPDYPGERLIACRNPALADERARKRDDLLAATQSKLAPILTRVRKGTLAGADRIGVAVGARARGVVVDPLGDQVQEARGGPVVGQHRQHQGHHALAEHPLADRHQLVELGPGVVQPGDHDRARHPDRGALLPEHLGPAVDAVDGRDHEQRRVGGAQTGPQVADEVRVAGGVEEVDLHAVDHDGGQRNADRALLADLGLVEVRDGVAIGRAARARDGPGACQHRLQECRLARAGRSDQDHVADVGGAGRCNDRPTTPCVRLGHHAASRRWVGCTGESQSTRTLVPRTRVGTLSLRSPRC